MAKTNMQYGMANRELRSLAEAYDLEGMKAVIEYTASYSMSKGLFKNLGSGQKQALKSILKKPALELIKDKAITKFLVPNVQPLLTDSEFVFLETDDKSINIKLVYREKKRQLCGPPIVSSEAVLIDFTLTQKDILDMRKRQSE